MLLSMLDLDPCNRPSVDDILTEAFVVCSLVDLYLNIGAVEVKYAALFYGVDKPMDAK